MHDKVLPSEIDANVMRYDEPTERARKYLAAAKGAATILDGLQTKESRKDLTRQVRSLANRAINETLLVRSSRMNLNGREKASVLEKHEARAVAIEGYEVLSNHNPLVFRPALALAKYGLKTRQWLAIRAQPEQS